MAVPAAKLPLSEHDYYAWLLEQAARLRARQFDQIDYEVLAEELEDMGRSERRAAESHLKNLLIHLLKWAKQKERRSGSWRDSIDNARDALADLLQDSPSLRPQLPAFVKRQYPRARRSAANQTGLTVARFPASCPFRLEEILDTEFFPETLRRRESLRRTSRRS